MNYFFFLIAMTTPLILSADSISEKLEALGFIDISTLDPTISVGLMYARKDNFVGEIMYDSLRSAYLHPEAAEALVRAQKALHEINPRLNLKVCDASRPMSVQKKMYNTVKGTQKARYVSNPANGGGLHNYGLAVDITIVDDNGNELPMGTPVDHLGKEANIDNEERLVSDGIITRDEQRNRQLLRKVMKRAGFIPLRSEWWHFNLKSRAVARQKYKLLDF